MNLKKVCIWNDKLSSRTDKLCCPKTAMMSKREPCNHCNDVTRASRRLKYSKTSSMVFQGDIERSVTVLLYWPFVRALVDLSSKDTPIKLTCIYNFNMVLIVEISPVEKLRQIAWLLVWYIKWQGVKSFLFAHTYHLASTKCPQRDQKLCFIGSVGLSGSQTSNTSAPFGERAQYWFS